MPSIPKKARTEGSTSFDPDKFFEAWQREQVTPPSGNNDFRSFILTAFGLSPRDAYVYRATAEVTLAQAQAYIEFGAQNGLHGWYRDDDGNARAAPSAADIAAYTDVFRATTSTPKALTALASNAKKDSIRADVARHLRALYAPPDPSLRLVVHKSKVHVNPSFDVWAWSNQNLEWTGPEERTVATKISHAILPVLYHHFGCVTPSYESLSYIRHVARGRPIVDVGSGNGYWTYMLRRLDTGPAPAIKVTAIDNGLSAWRTMWIGDSVEADGCRWLQQHDGGRDQVLLLVYPVVGDDFTARTIRAYKGTTVVVAGSQNANGYTAFAHETIDAWMAREMPSWTKTLQIPLPSFAAKDEALFVFEQHAEKTTGGG